MNKNSKELSNTKEETMLAVSRVKAKYDIEERMLIGKRLLNKFINSHDMLEIAEHEFSKWDSYNTLLLKRLFTTDEVSLEYSSWFVAVVRTNQSLNQLIEEHKVDIKDHLKKLDRIIDKLDLFETQTGQDNPTKQSVFQSQIESNNKVFIVHGHDENALLKLQRFLASLGLSPIILNVEANQGMTIIEKFEKHSDVGYAFMLMTPDEFAFLTPEEKLHENERRKYYRARPNVIFEFGYFVAKLGRNRVCCLRKGSVEIPSDLHGLLYIQYKDTVEEITESIRKELGAAGFILNQH